MGLETEAARFIAIALFIGCAGFWLSRHRDAFALLSPRRTIKIARKMKRKEWIRLFVVSFVLIAVLLAFIPLTAKFLESITQQPLTSAEEHPVAVVSSFSIPLTFFLMGTLPIFEEWLYRGIVLERLKRKIPLLNAVIISSFFFGLMHILNSGTFLFAFIPPTIAGFVFSISYLTNGLGGAIFTHSVYNCIALSLMVF